MASNNKRSKILIGAYGSSWRISMMAMAVVGALELFMLAYTVVDPALFGEYMGTYRIFYLVLLALAVIYIALSFFVKKDLEHRYMMLTVANPVCAVLMIAWAIGITYFDAMKFGTIDAMVFMTFSLTVPLIFVLFPAIYAGIAIAADAVMLYLTVTISGSTAPLINLSIFFIFQIVLGISLLRLKMNLAQRIVEEQENADIDIMTGFPNRRVYEEDMKALGEKPLQKDLVYIAIDINGLKETNDRYGHEAGDKLIIGAARCIERGFGNRVKRYRIGGDEYVVLVVARSDDDLRALLSDFERCTKAWSERYGMKLSISYGYVRCSERPEGNIMEVARIADMRMYAAKNRYYEVTGRDRRRYLMGDYEPSKSSFTS